MFFEFKYWALENTKTKLILFTDEKQDLILKVFDYFEAESKLSLGESEMNISCILGFW
jgi:hypothetical protein